MGTSRSQLFLRGVILRVQSTAVWPVDDFNVHVVARGALNTVWSRRRARLVSGWPKPNM